MTTNSASQDDVLPSYRHITVPRTARYCLLGDTTASASEIWFAVHGYGQLAVRFARHFVPLAARDRVVVVPEGLSRFYLEHPGRAPTLPRVGATWMTREDRDAEIADHVRYLDLLHDEVIGMLGGPRPRVHMLGFSQGVATVTRWLAHGRVHADRVILWAGRIPPDLLPMGPEHPLRQVELDIVGGEEDEFATEEVLREQRAFIEEAGLRPRWHRFPGGHRLDGVMLQALADGRGQGDVSASGGGR